MKKYKKLLFKFRTIVKWLGIIFLLGSISLFVFLCVKGTQIFYYLTATSATIGFGLITLYFSVDSALKKADDVSNERAKITNDVIEKFSVITSSVDFVFASTLSQNIYDDLSKGVHLLCENETKESYIISVSKKITSYLANENTSFSDYLTEKTDQILEMLPLKKEENIAPEIFGGLIINELLSKFEPIAYLNANDKFEDQIFDNEMKEDMLSIYFVYIVFNACGILERNCDFIELSLFEKKNYGIIKSGRERNVKNKNSK